MNPEFRQTLQHFTRNLESANEAAQENIYSFTQTYIDPCITGIKSCVYNCTAPCFPNREDQLRRRRGRTRGQGQYDFDFYDDWDEDELGASSVHGWGNGELDRLLAGRGASQPRRQRAMSYGTRRRNEIDGDPNIIPKSSYLGFLERLPFRIGATGVKYKPSAANLAENPGGLRIRDVEAAEPLLTDDEDTSWRQGHKRQRSGTEASRSTMTSHSSRGDLIMSDEEDDAIPLDDEFATAMLSRRTTSTGEEHGAGKIRRSAGSRISSRTVSTRSFQGHDSPQLENKKAAKSPEIPQENIEDADQEYEPPTLLDLKHEEEHLRQQQELEIVQKREAAQKLAQSMEWNKEVKSPGPAVKSHGDAKTPAQSPSKQPNSTGYFALSSPITSSHETEPFPGIETPRSPHSPLSAKGKPNDQPG